MKKKTLCLVAVPLIGLSVCVKLCAADSGEDSAVEEVVRTPQDLVSACWKGSEAVRICLCAGVDPNALYSDMHQAHGDVGFKRPLWGLATAKNIGTPDWEKAFNFMIRAGARLDLNIFIGTLNSGRTERVCFSVVPALGDAMKFREQATAERTVEQTFLDLIEERAGRGSGIDKEKCAEAARLVRDTKDLASVWHEASAYAAVIFVLYTDEHQAL